MSKGRDARGQMAAVVVASAVALCAACATSSRISDCAQDRQQLQRALDSDQRIDQWLHAADEVASKGQGQRAAAIIADQAAPLASGATEQLRNWNARTPWGEKHKQAALLLLQERQRTMQQYADALRSDDLQRVVDQMSAQQGVEKRAMELDRQVREPVSLASGDCERR
jgi:hypothetical protein